MKTAAVSHRGEITGLAFSRDGAWIVSSSEDGTLKIWDRASEQLKRTLYWSGPAARWIEPSTPRRFRADALSTEELVEKADEMLYKAKRNGKKIVFRLCGRERGTAAP